MLCQITFENFKSFKKQAFLDLFAEKLQEHEKSLVTDLHDGETFLPVIAIYGSEEGKQDLIECFTYLTQNTPFHATNTDFPNHTTGSFDILFRIGQTEYRYQKTISKATFKEENLYAKDLVSSECFIGFERNEKEHYIGSQFTKIQECDINSWFSKCRILKGEDLNEKQLLEDLLNGDLVIAHQIDTRFSSEAVKNIINRFKDPTVNKIGAQLIFTTQDTSIMNSSVLRRDEIWFLSVNKKNQSKLYSLVEFKTNAKAKEFEGDYAKQYLEGKYGAEPIFIPGENP